MEMTPKQWELVKDLYQTALECSPAQRTSFLEQNERDELVRAEVHRLLGVHSRLGAFLSSPAFVDPRRTGANPPERLTPGEVLAGRFRIVNFVAAGGMGEVYKAEDLLLDRMVALKLLPEALAEDRESLEQFLSEAKTASALNHPNICTVYDFGEDAIRLDADLADAHRNLAWLKLDDESDPKGAEIEYLKSLRMNDMDARTHHWYAQLLLAERRPMEAIKEAQRGLELDPLGLGSNYNFAFILIRAGRPHEGIVHLEKLLQREPGNEVVLGYLGLGYEELKQYGKAAEFLGQAAKASELKYQYEASMVYPLAKNGALADAQRIAQELLAKKSNGQWIPGYNLAVMYVGLKDFDKAFYWLDQCHIDRSCSLLEVETNPIRQELSSDPRFGPLQRAFGGE